ncbi:hypothetical protein L207DRAFT_538322 [Hyaloscypha variabilis F]|uniref:Cyanovirin-N domain-containing protein n=1 Tax=Hyaloscypha variabilis (strain UAMH 11265 / GT02V1 / F) TaxID=1149755 RepID=A0A2J6QV57_HYAVF|nr:hypothetical protein L207DRAFT_538322 [Hyaloscypha variabilis F]
MMALLALTIFLAVSSVVTALPADGHIITSRSVPACSTFGANPDNKPCFGPYINGEARNSLPEWSEPVQGGWSGGNMTEFCIRDGPVPNPSDIQKLCSKINDSHIIARTKLKKDNEKHGNCFCKSFHQSTAWFEVCNCDACDRLEILSGLKDMCKASTELCSSKGYSSGFLRLDEKNGLLVQYNVNPKNAKSGKLDRDPILIAPKLTKSTCNSNDEFKKHQDYTGPVVNCWRSWKTFWTARKCHDNSKDTPLLRSPDYWHNKYLQKWSHDIHLLFDKPE